VNFVARTRELTFKECYPIGIKNEWKNPGKKKTRGGVENAILEGELQPTVGRGFVGAVRDMTRKQEAESEFKKGRNLERLEKDRKTSTWQILGILIGKWAKAR